ncbi:beta-microseminoprotein [Amia ocellicauda]|uniref:beta-microseminoprotein n=1 Tax=Amia ocellicauda TaxID=2972642 RepID=UPI00346395C5
MSSLLGVTLGLLALIALCSAQCTFQQLVLENINDPLKGCQDTDGVMHTFGSRWMKDCYECECITQGISCCNKIETAVEVPLDCEIIVNKKDCSAKAVLKKDPTKDCAQA